MASRRPTSGRIEPVFDVPASRGEDIRLGADDRIIVEVPPKKRETKTGSKIRKERSRPPKAAARRGWLGALRKLAYWSLVLCIWGGIGVACLVGYYAAKLPSMASWSIPKRPPNARIVSVDGELIANRGVTGGEAMRLDEMSPWIPLAVVAIEDRRFKQHAGVDPIGLGRAMLTNVISGRLVQGGSTLTQQLAKNLFLNPQRTLERKVQEAMLALWLETRFSKDEILELYLNRVYFGSGAWGVDAAARRYFNKSARDVSLAEAALIAGLLKAPSRLSPARDAKAAEERAQTVLGAMRREGFVTDREAAQALAMEPQKARRYLSGSQHYVADMVMAQLPGLIGEMRADVIVSTSVDLDLQMLAGQLISGTISKKGEKLNVAQGALVSIDGTGAIRALVGGRDYSASQFNRASDAKRQPGSAFKPIVYLAALEAGRTPASIRRDEPVKIGNWTPENYDRKYRGPVTLDTALARSLNTIAAQLVMETGPKSVIETARRLGIASPMQSNASIALGTSEVSLVELTSAYAPFANGGYKATPWLIRRVTTANGDILYERAAEEMPLVVNAREIGMMNSMLKHVVSEGTGTAARLDGWETAGKTGTTQNSRDAFFIGYTANLVTGVWYGNDDGDPMNKVTGGGIPAETFAKYMQAAHEGVPPAALPGRYQPQIAPRGNEVAGGELPPFLEGRDENTTTEPALPRPAGSVGASGEQRRKPRNILELLFGRAG